MLKISIKERISIITLGVLFSFCCAAQSGKHLFILSGQSNMVHLRPKESFIPAVEKEFGAENVIVVKSAMGSQPIRRWYRDWRPLTGSEPKADPAWYDSLMKKVYPEIQNNKIATVSFIWMQGEADAREKLGDVYERSLVGLYHQLCSDIQRQDVNFVIGRLSDFDLANKKFPHWTMIRDIQVKVAESNPLFGWVDTDDLNDGINRDGKMVKDDLHLSAEGYKTLGYRFAEKAIQLIQQKK